jgi:dimethylamine monooxygenase subunit A
MRPSVKDIDPPIYLPFESGQWRMSLGLKALPPSEWIEIDCNFDRYLQRKAELRQERFSEVYAGLPGSEAAQQEVLDLLLEHLVQVFPHYYQHQGSAIANLITGEVWTLSEFAATPLDLAGRLVQEDWCLMLPGAEGYFLGAASLSFPLHWQLQDKLGKAIAFIHDPVPGYAQHLTHPVNTYFDRLPVTNPGYRFNWSITTTPELFLGFHRAPQKPAEITFEQAGERLWIRVERQTLRRLPQSQAILFGIRTHLYPLAILQGYPQAGQGLLQVLPQIPSTMQLYKSLSPIRATLEEYLQAIAHI